MLYKEAITNTTIIVTVMPLFYLLLIHLPGNRYYMNLNHFHVSQNPFFWAGCYPNNTSVTRQRSSVQGPGSPDYA